MFSIPTPLRPEHRLTQLATTLKQIPLTHSHALIEEFQSCTQAKQSWLMLASSATPPPHSMTPATVIESRSSQPSPIRALPLQARQQLQLFDEESQRLYWLYEFCADSNLLSHCTQLPTASSPTSPTGAAVNIAPLPTNHISRLRCQRQHSQMWLWIRFQHY